MERLQKYIARAGISSRRKAEKLIEKGRVTVNGQKATLGMKVSGQEIICLQNERIIAKSEHITYAIYKPRGVISTVTDTHKRKTVMELAPKVKGLHPVGRLDADSEGLLLLTNDGELTLKLTHPRYGHEKEYQVWCAEGKVHPKDLQALCKGIVLNDGLAKAVKNRAASQGCYLTITEGRKHQVRRMLAKLGYKVTRLKRIRINKLTLGNLQAGQHRVLGPEDFIKIDYSTS